MTDLVAESCNDLAPSDPYCPCIVSAIAKNDSAYGTAGVGARQNNPGNSRCIADIFAPHGTRCIESANGSFSAFSSLEDGTRTIVSLYVRKYAGKTPDDITRIWAGNPKSKQYWADIRNCY